MIKLICIKEPVGVRISPIKLGDIYYSIYEVTSKGDLLYCITNETGTSRKQYWSKNFLMPYDEWLAIEREKQIKSILDD